MKIERKDYTALSIVALAGATGGLIAKTNDIFNSPAQDFSLVALGLAVALGAFAAVVFMFVVVNTDRSDVLRLIAFAALVGFFHLPAIEIGGQYVSLQSDQRKARTAHGDLASISALRDRAAADQISRTEAVAEAQEIWSSFNATVAEIRDPRVVLDLQRQYAEFYEELQGGNAASDEIRGIVTSRPPSGLIAPMGQFRGIGQ